MKNLSNLGKILCQTQLKEVYGGRGLESNASQTVTCEFDDGTSWEGTTGNSVNTAEMISHCSNSGGSYSVTTNYIAP